jgi:GT2 family glycosyltransferase
MSAVAAILVSWNRADDLARAIGSILAQELPPGLSLRLLVLDDGSTDGTATALRSIAARDPRVQCWRGSRNLRPAVARNLLLGKVTEQYVLFLDSDAYLQSPNALARFADFLDGHPNHAVVGGTIWSDDAHAQPPFLIGGYLTPMLHADLPRWRTEHEAPHFLSSCCSLWRTEAIRRVGGFDPFYGHGIEDVDLCLRVVRAGGLLQVLPDAWSVHAMSDLGRHRPWRELRPVFRYLEWTRPYLRLKLDGWFGALRRFIAELSQRTALEADYGVQLRRIDVLRALVVYPAIHAALWLPWWRTRSRGNHLAAAQALWNQVEEIRP